MRKRIKFVKPYNHYFQGDIAGFRDRLADNLVRKGIAVPYVDQASTGVPPSAEQVPDPVPEVAPAAEGEDTVKDDLMGMKHRELKAIAEELSISTSGTKNKLVGRIIEAMQDAK